jgi:hypothetical protein
MECELEGYHKWIRQGTGSVERSIALHRRRMVQVHGTLQSARSTDEGGTLKETRYEWRCGWNAGIATLSDRYSNAG